MFAEPGSHTALAVWIAVLFYAVQIYCDFSGHTDMAIACAGLLGYELGPNFNFPYFADSVTEFWRRWHISLSTWLRDYLIHSAGGQSRLAPLHLPQPHADHAPGRLWHGAAWTFVVWGALHGLLLVVHRAWKGRVSLAALGVIGRLLATAATFYFVCFAWIFFRAKSFADVASIARAYVLFQDGGPKTLDPILLAVFGGLAAVYYLYHRGWPEHMMRRLPGWAFAVVYGAVTALALAFVPLRTDPFIYFQF